MIFFPITVFALSLVSAEFAGKNEFHKTCLSKESTTAVNGLFVLLVFIKHAFDQSNLASNVFNESYRSFGRGMGQLVVVTFLFYSGYGITCSIMNKGMPYVKSIPKKRFLKVLLHFDIAVMIYVVLNVIMRRNMKWYDILLSLVGWSDVGNSNWYIFSVMVLYLIVFISFFAFKGRIYPSLVMTIALICAFSGILFAAERPMYYYNTLMCFALGMVYAALKEKVEKFIQKSDAVYVIVFGSIGISFLLLSLSHHEKTFPHSIWAMLFSLLIVMITMKLKIGNGMLDYFGKRVFSIYILQRIPMIIFKEVPFIYNNGYIYILFCFLFTLVAAQLFEKITNCVDKKLFV